MRDEIIINFISETEEFQWLGLTKYAPKKIKFIFTKYPIEADFHILYHVTNGFDVPNSKERIAFIISEPPEIQKISLKFLRQFGYVFSPNFEYLRSLENLKRGGGLLPPQAGIIFKDGKPNLVKTLDKIINSGTTPRNILISVVLSNKRITRQQRARVKLIKYLENEIPGLEVYGRGFKEIDDKAEILLQSKYHIALENSSHVGYWTEKYVDALICGCQIFYVGDPELTKVFSSFTVLNIHDFEYSKKVILNSLRSNLWETNFEKRKSDLEKYLLYENVIQDICNWVTSCQENSKIVKTRIYPENRFIVRFFKILKIRFRFFIFAKFSNVLNVLKISKKFYVKK
jgi:hypothetical protein